MVGTRTTQPASQKAAQSSRTRTRTPPPTAKSPKTSKAGGKCFATYATAPEQMGPEGVQKLFEDLGVGPTDPVALVLAYHCRAQNMGEFSSEEFARGMSTLGCNTLLQLKAKIPQMRAELHPCRSLKEIYSFTFDYSLDEGARRVPVDVAVALWGILLRPAEFPLMEAFVAWIANREEFIKRDLWSEVWSFATTVKPDLSNYDENPAWPVILDEFVEHRLGQTGQ